jgi:outer membrane protein OmpA-like peptidoglycan-associated protein
MTTRSSIVNNKKTNKIHMKIIIYSILTFVLGLNTCLGQENKIVKDSLKIEIKNCGEYINSPFADYSSSISADRSILMITSRRPQSQKEIKKKMEGKELIYYSNFNDSLSTWNKIELFKEPINLEGRNSSVITVSNDASIMLLYRDGNNVNGDIYQSVLHGSDWSELEKMPSPINSESHESSASFSPDGKTVYFVSDRPLGKGGRDIWYCKKDAKGKWGKAINLGNSINSKEDEEGVFIHPDGKTLYFSSKKAGGLGAYDVYKSVNEKEKWSVAENLGPQINSISNDVFYVLSADGKYGYLTSDRIGTLGGYDIFEIQYEEIKSDTTKAVTQSHAPKLTLLKGIITDHANGKPLEAEIEVIDNNTKEIISTIKSNSITGKYLVSLPVGKNYAIVVKKEGYLFHSENFDLPLESDYQQVNKDVELEKVSIGSKIVLKNIFFEFNKFVLLPTSEDELIRLVRLMNDNPTINIEISGHTDNIGSAVYNQYLSEERAKSVVKFLVEHGVSATRLTFKGYGFVKPIASNDNEQGRALNRRIEFLINNGNSEEPKGTIKE